MYGYIRPDRGELRVREYELYRAAYCGLCETLRERGGPVSRLAVNYDMTFLAMLLSAGASTQLRRCPLHPVEKCECLCPSPALEAAADYSVILAWWKLRDNIQDEGALRALLSRSGTAAGARAYRRAALAHGAFDGYARDCLRELAELEQNGDASLDAAADCFARLLAFAAGEAADEAQQRIYREVLYHVGRSVYILDAVDDLADDLAAERFNPLRNMLSSGQTELPEEQKLALRSTLNLSQRCASAALLLRPADQWQPILENILMRGLPAVTEMVFSGEWKNRRRRHRDEFQL